MLSAQGMPVLRHGGASHITLHVMNAALNISRGLLIDSFGCEGCQLMVAMVAMHAQCWHSSQDDHAGCDMLKMHPPLILCMCVSHDLCVMHTKFQSWQRCEHSGMALLHLVHAATGHQPGARHHQPISHVPVPQLTPHHFHDIMHVSSECVADLFGFEGCQVMAAMVAMHAQCWHSSEDAHVGSEMLKMHEPPNLSMCAAHSLCVVHTKFQSLQLCEHSGMAHIHLVHAATGHQPGARHHQPISHVPVPQLTPHHFHDIMHVSSECVADLFGCESCQLMAAMVAMHAECWHIPEDVLAGYGTLPTKQPPSFCMR